MLKLFPQRCLTEISQKVRVVKCSICIWAFGIKAQEATEILHRRRKTKGFIQAISFTKKTTQEL